MRPRLLAVIPATAAVALALLAAAPGAAQAPPGDARQRLALTAPARDKILAEMRAMLESLHGVLSGLGSGDRAAAERAARAAGMGTAADVEPAVMRQLPAGFRALGMQTHQGFDRLADQIRGGASVPETLDALTRVTANCVACHATYRLDEAR